MKFKKLLLVLLIGIVILSGCSKKKTNPKKEPEKKLPAVEEKSIESVNDLTYDLFKNSFKSDENLLLSPYSLYELMSMIYNASGGTTEQQIKDFLTLPVKEETNINSKALRDNLVASKEIVSISNGVFMRNDFSFSNRIDSEFINPLKNYYDAEIKKTPFDNETVTEINNWIKSKTNGMITKMLDEIPEEAVMYLINAVYFKGEWQNQFKEEDTFKELFNNKMVDMMHRYYTDFLYYSEKGVKVIQLPYQDKYAMNIYLKDDGEYENIDIKDLTEKLNGSYKQEISKLSLPKFTYETPLILFNDYLSDIDIFDQSTNLDIIGENIYVSKIIHKAKIIVNEKGTEAAAVTIGGMETASAPADIINFVVDKPFIYTIVHKDTGTILFIGYMNEI
jgi:Serine protease inhibitor